MNKINKSKVIIKETKNSTKSHNKAPVPVFECIFCARSDKNIVKTLNLHLYTRFENMVTTTLTLQNYLSKCPMLAPPKDIVQPVHSCSPQSALKNIFASNDSKPVAKLRFQKPRLNWQSVPQSPVPAPQRFLAPQRLLPHCDPLINQSSCITIRNSERKPRRMNVSFCSSVHNIYDPSFSSEVSSPVSTSSLQISFNLQDSYEELRIDPEMENLKINGISMDW